MTKYRFTKDRRMTPREQPEPSPTPYVRPKLSELLLQRAEWWFNTEDLSEPHVTAQSHMMSLTRHPLHSDHAPYFLGDWFVYSSWLCLFEANFQLTDGEG